MPPRPDHSAPAARSTLFAVACALAWAGCAPVVTAPYRDFEDARFEARIGMARDTLDLPGRTRRALEAAGWTTRAGVVEAMVRTDPRPMRPWGLYVTEVELEALPLSGGHVRVLVHPYRRWIVGGRRKVPYLRSGLSDEILRELAPAMRAEGLVVLGTPAERDRRAGAR